MRQSIADQAEGAMIVPTAFPIYVAVPVLGSSTGNEQHRREGTFSFRKDVIANQRFSFAMKAYLPSRHEGYSAFHPWAAANLRAG